MIDSSEKRKLQLALIFRVRVFIKSAVNQEGRSRLTSCQHYESPVWLA